MNIKRFLQPMYKPEPTGGSSKKYLNARVQMKRDTAANWEVANPVILAGEFIIVTTANGETRFKVGDGTKRYTQLPFTDEPIRGLIGEKLGKTEAAAKVQNKLNIFGQDYDGSAPITIDATSHTHTQAQVTGLMTALDDKAAKQHTHAMSDVTNLTTTLSGKANSVHTHTIAQVTDLESRLAALEAREAGTKVTLYRYVSA